MKRLWVQLIAAAMIGWVWPAEAGAGFAGQAAAATAGAGGSIPAVHSTTLTGQAVDLPGMLSGKVGVLVVGFSRGSREPVAAWGRRLAAEYKGSATVLYFEMPMLAEVPKIMRGMVIRSMRKEVPERAQPRFVPLTDSEAAWKTLVGYGNEDDAYVLVVDGKGRVQGRAQGAVTEAAFAAVRSRVGAAASGSRQP